MYSEEEEWDPEWDSTWEEEEEGDPGTPRPHQGCSRHSWAARDMQVYRRGYPGKKEPDTVSDHLLNLQFYQNKLCFQPDGEYIDTILSSWKGDYDLLERNHSYIQWLFPLREKGMNWYAKPLTVQEIQELKADKEAMERFLEAYKLMLDFYGIALKNEKTGEVEAAPEWSARFRNLNSHSHNNLRITRILKCLGELGFEHFQAPLVKFFLQETLVSKRLENVKRSALDYFMFTVKNKEQRRELVRFAWECWSQFKQSEKFVWGPMSRLQPKMGEDRIPKSRDKGECLGTWNNVGPKDGGSPCKLGNKEECSNDKRDLEGGVMIGLKNREDKGEEESGNGEEEQDGREDRFGDQKGNRVNKVSEGREGGEADWTSVTKGEGTSGCKREPQEHDNLGDPKRIKINTAKDSKASDEIAQGLSTCKIHSDCNKDIAEEEEEDKHGRRSEEMP
ncbi:hypothetical protein GDO86_014614, partial [Hymenochirus boettgeri]